MRTLESRALPNVEPHVELRTAPPGPVRFEAIASHTLHIHTGAAARASCARYGTRVVVERGDLSILPIGAYDECVQDDPSSYLVLQLPSALVRLAAEDLGLDPDRTALEPRSCFRDPRIEHIAYALEAEHRAQSRSSLLYRESLGLALAVHLLGTYRAPSPLRRERGLSAAQLARVTEWIEAHLDRDVSLPRLAKVAGMSASHFRVLFKRSTALPVHEYVIRRRVERARTLLLRGELDAAQVALESGFAHQSHMARCMRRVLGVTPSQLARAR